MRQPWMNKVFFFFFFLWLIDVLLKTIPAFVVIFGFKRTVSPQEEQNIFKFEAANKMASMKSWKFYFIFAATFFLFPSTFYFCNL